ncbi:TPA_asm: M [Artemisia alphacytorhabdovirus 3]|nr:TPA_asm: M [Artemisia alphacytorhabdovirus 3]
MMMTTPNILWRSVSVKYTNASLDFKKGSEPIKTKSKTELAESVESLLLASGGSIYTSRMIASMINCSVVKKFFDYYTSPLLGPKTQRLNFVFPLYIVVPVEVMIPCAREEIKAVGRKGIIGGRQVLSNFELDVVIEDVPPNMIEATLLKHPEWFVGELDYKGGFVPDAMKDVSSTAMKPANKPSK